MIEVATRAIGAELGTVANLTEFANPRVRAFALASIKIGSTCMTVSIFQDALVTKISSPVVNPMDGRTGAVTEPVIGIILQNASILAFERRRIAFGAHLTRELVYTAAGTSIVLDNSLIRNALDVTDVTMEA